MKDKRKIIMILFAVVFIFILSACNSNKTVKVRFIVDAPNYTPEEDDIYIAGDFGILGLSDWDPADAGSILTKKGNKYEIEFILPDNIEYPVKLSYKYSRGSWDNVESGITGGEVNNRLILIDGKKKLVIREDTIRNWKDLYVYEGPDTVTGNLNIVDITDERFPNDSQKTRKLRIWTPSNYDPSNKEKKYKVIYMHDAQNLFDQYTSFAGEWEVDETLTQFEEAGFDEAIVVGIDNSPERFGEYVYNYPFLEGAMGAIKTGHYYMDFIVDVVKPYIDENYNTDPTRENTFIGGSSLGGLISLFGGLAHLDTFGGILAFSTSTQLVEDEALADYFESLEQALLKETKFFFYVGTKGDGNALWPSNYESYLLELDVKMSNIKIVIGENYSHNENAWKTFFPKAIEFLFDVSPLET